MVASRLFSFRSMSSPHQPGRRKDSPSAQLGIVYIGFFTFATCAPHNFERFSKKVFQSAFGLAPLLAFDSGLTPERDAGATLFKHTLDAGHGLGDGHLRRLSPRMDAADG